MKWINIRINIDTLPYNVIKYFLNSRYVHFSDIEKLRKIYDYDEDLYINLSNKKNKFYKYR